MKKTAALMATLALCACLPLAGCGNSATNPPAEEINQTAGSSSTADLPEEAEQASSFASANSDTAGLSSTVDLPEEAEQASSFASANSDTAGSSSTEQTEPAASSSAAASSAASSAAASSADTAAGTGESSYDDASSETAYLSNAIQDSDTSGTNPAPLGQWVKTCAFSTVDHTYHPIYVRVKKITTQSDDPQYIDDCVENSNANSYDFDRIDLSALTLPDDVELCIVDYEILFSDSFPSEGGIIFSSGLGMTAMNPEGTGMASQDGASTYVGMGQVEDLALQDTTQSVPLYKPGNKNAMQGIFAMVKGSPQYVLSYQSYREGTTRDTMSVDTMVKVFHAVR